MRCLHDLIEELTTERKVRELTEAAIIVGLYKLTKLVWYDEASDMLSELNSLVNDGGQPIGLIGYGYVQLPREVRFYRRAFAEYAEEDWVESFLEKMMSTMKQQFELRGFRTVDMGEPENN